MPRQEGDDQGTGAGETLKGTPKNDVIAGRGGNDTIKGRGGNDRICGGPGNDKLLGGGGNDKLFGDAGNDVLTDTKGGNILNGGKGANQCTGAPGDRLIHCGGSPAQRTLTVTVAGAGTGEVTGPGINCPGDCTQSYDQGTQVQLQAITASGSRFAGWGGDCAGTGACMLDMSADHAVTATADPHATVYVSAALGNDSNPGTSVAPYATVSQGIAGALPLGTPARVDVGEGTYPESVTLAEGVSLYGGFDCPALPCSWVRSPGSNISTIAAQDFTGVQAPASITRATHLDGFTITGKPGALTGSSGAALTVEGGSPFINGNVIAGGNVTGGSSPQASYGIAVRTPGGSPGPLIHANQISSGSAAGTSAAVAVVAGTPGTAVAEISNNTVTAGSGASSYGINASLAGAGTAINANTVLAGSSSSFGGSWGIALAGGPITLDANRVNANQASVGTCATTNPCGGIRSDGAAATLTNNVVFGVKGSYSIALLAQNAEGGGVQTLIVNANYLDGAGTASSAGTKSMAVSIVLNSGTNALIGRLRNNILYGGVNATRYGVYEGSLGTKTAKPEKLENNNLFNTTVLYRSWDGTTETNVTTIANVNALANSAANINADCLVSSSFHLGGGSPCIDAGTATEAPSTDFEGGSRPQGGGVDIGPDEAG